MKNFLRQWLAGQVDTIMVGAKVFSKIELPDQVGDLCRKSCEGDGLLNTDSCRQFLPSGTALQSHKLHLECHHSKISQCLWRTYCMRPQSSPPLKRKHSLVLGELCLFIFLHKFLKCDPGPLVSALKYSTCKIKRQKSPYHPQAKLHHAIFPFPPVNIATKGGKWKGYNLYSWSHIAYSPDKTYKYSVFKAKPPMHYWITFYLYLLCF